MTGQPEGQLTIQQEVETLSKHYREVIRPMIDKGQYMMACFELGNVVFAMQSRQQELIREVHCGLSYISAAEVLEEHLHTATSFSDVRSAVEMFEAYAAQTRLPMGTKSKQ